MGKKKAAKPWGAIRKGKTYGENSIRYFPLCLWCGHEFAAKRPDAKTCKTAHRVALARYVAKHGQPPMFPFGHVRCEKPASRTARSSNT